ncbi:hypothetical protein [Okibacterium endophyticum]
MDPLSGLALLVVAAGIFFYALYGVIRRAVSDGIRDAEKAIKKETEV